MDTTMTDVSTVMRSMPTPPSDARIQASMTIPLSKTRSRASRKLVRSAVRSTGIAHSVSSRKVVVPGERSAVGAANRRATVLLRLVDGTDDQPDGIARSSTSAIEMHRSPATARPLVEHAVENVDDAARTMPCPLVLWPCPCVYGSHPLSNRQRGRNRDTVQRGCLIRYAQISAS